MTDRIPGDDRRAEDIEEVVLDSGSVARPASAHGHAGSMALPEESPGPAGSPERAMASPEDLALAYDSGVEPKARSQWAYARIRFFRHKMAVLSMIVLIAVGFIAIFAKRIAPYGFDELDLFNITSGPTLKDKHLFGTDLLGRDYLSRVIFGLRTSLWVAFFVAFLSTTIGTTIGALAGYYGGVVDNLLMRFTDLILTLPGLAVLLTVAALLGHAAARSRSASSSRSSSGRGSPGSCAASSSRSARRSTSRRRRPAARATSVSSCATCFRTRSARSSSTPRS